MAFNQKGGSTFRLSEQRSDPTVGYRSCLARNIEGASPLTPKARCDQPCRRLNGTKVTKSPRSVGGREPVTDSGLHTETGGRGVAYGGSGNQAAPHIITSPIQASGALPGRKTFILFLLVGLNIDHYLNSNKTTEGPQREALVLGRRTHPKRAEGAPLGEHSTR